MRGNNGFIVFGAAFIAVVIGVLIYFSDDRRVDDSLIGLRGLSQWLGDQDIPVQHAHRRIRPKIDDLSLRILPIYDTDLESYQPEPETNIEQFELEALQDIYTWMFENKINGLQSVVVLPKWRRGMIDSGVAHQVTLIPESNLLRLAEQMGRPNLRFGARNAEFTMDMVDGLEIGFFHAQVFTPASVQRSECRPLITFGDGVLAATCPTADRDHETIFLSDPDLLNNHGLRIADNAQFATDWLTDLTAGRDGKIYVDTSDEILINYQTEDFGEYYERTGEDLARFFTYPLSVLWALMFVVLAVLYWRGARMFGPMVTNEELGALEQTKTDAIATKARLLRLSGNDGKMVADFVQTQLHDLASRTLGPHLGDRGLKLYFSHLARRDAELAAEFQRTANYLMSSAPAIPVPELHRHVSHYATLLEQVTQSHGTK